MSTPTPSRSPSRTIAGAAIAALFALALFVALPPRGPAPPEVLEFLGRFHTLAVHLPIGVLLLIATAELLTRSARLRARIDPALDLALPFLVATAVASFALGLLLARGGGYPARLVGLHRLFTLGAVLGTSGCLVAWSTRIREGGDERRRPYRAALAATVGLLTLGAHFGGSLTHGDTYLTRYAPPFLQRLMGAPPPAPVEAAVADPGAEPLVFASAVMPLLRRECVECHGPDKSKGGLRLDSLAAIMKGGDDGADVLPGRGAISPLVKRMLLPATDDDHMPPSAKPQPVSGEVELLSWWIDRGANDTLRVRDAIVPDGARTILGSTLDGAGGPPSPTPAARASAVGAARPSAATSPPVTAAAPEPATAGAGRLAYHDVIGPMLGRACGRCHGDQKQKGKLRVDSLAALTAGGKSGAGIVRGSASQGTVLARLRLPLDDDKHMPPRDERQLSGPQIAMLASWIGEGASDTLPASKLPRGVGVAPAGDAAAKAPRAPALARAATEPSPAATAPVLAPIEVPPGHVALYRDVVAPLLARRCGECHGEERAEGGMRVDDLARLVRDKDLVPGKPGDSPLVQRMTLPANDADRMPPAEKPPAAAWEAAAVAAWVTRGAGAQAIVAVNDLPPGVAAALNLAASPAAVASAVTRSPAEAAAAGGAPPPGATVPLRASGCGACKVGVGAGTSDPALAFGVAALLGGGLASRRRRSRAARAFSDAREARARSV